MPVPVPASVPVVELVPGTGTSAGTSTDTCAVPVPVLEPVQVQVISRTTPTHHTLFITALHRLLHHRRFIADDSSQRFLRCTCPHAATMRCGVANQGYSYSSPLLIPAIRHGCLLQLATTVSHHRVTSQPVTMAILPGYSSQRIITAFHS